MTKFLPIFPLELVLFPDEHLNLHIFEPRYKEMIKDCMEKDGEFGILPVINGSIKDIGTSVLIKKVEKEYEDGKLDIRTIGGSVFRVLELMKEIPNKPYSGAIISFIDTEPIKVGKQLSDLITNEVKRLIMLLDDQALQIHSYSFENSFDIGHKVGLTLEQELELLQLTHEIQRQEYIRRHLKNIEPMLVELEKLKNKIKQNGHFKDINGIEL